MARTLSKEGKLMKRTRILLVILALLASLLATASAMAQSSKNVFTIKHVVCTESGGKSWASAGRFHLRGAANAGYIISTEPRLVGVSTIIFDADINTATGAGTGSGTVVFLPAADNVHGTWKGTLKENNPGTPESRTGTAFLRGTDDLAGFELTVKIKGTTDLSGAPATTCPKPTAADILTVHIWRTK
jgi:hypothetical protein